MDEAIENYKDHVQSKMQDHVKGRIGDFMQAIVNQQRVKEVNREYNIEKDKVSGLSFMYEKQSDSMAEPSKMTSVRASSHLERVKELKEMKEDDRTRLIPFAHRESGPLSCEHHKGEIINIYHKKRKVKNLKTGLKEYFTDEIASRGKASGSENRNIETGFNKSQDSFTNFMVNNSNIDKAKLGVRRLSSQPDEVGGNITLKRKTVAK